jgi:histidine triad (HIT) family protein
MRAILRRNRLGCRHLGLLCAGRLLYWARNLFDDGGWPMNTDCIFCRIVGGELPSSGVYADEHVIAFLDIGPIVKGHTLVVPRRHFQYVYDIPADELARVVAVVKKVASAQRRALGCDGVNVTQANGRCAGQVVPHLHFHVIPRFDDDGHHWNWKSKSYDAPEEMRAVADRLRGGFES